MLEKVRTVKLVFRDLTPQLTVIKLSVTSAESSLFVLYGLLFLERPQSYSDRCMQEVTSGANISCFTEFVYTVQEVSQVDSAAAAAMSSPVR